MTAITVIAFDLGGVLFSEGKSNSTQALKQLGYDPALVLPFLASEKAHALRRGELTDHQFWTEWMQPQLPKAYDALTIKDAWYNGYILDDDIANLLKELRALTDRNGKRCYILATFSGNIASRVTFLDQKYGFRAWFDKEVWSYDCHLNKPDPTFLMELVKRSGAASPSEIFYIDDNAKDAQHASGMGFRLHLYHRGEIKSLRDRMRAEGINVAT